MAPEFPPSLVIFDSYFDEKNSLKGVLTYVEEAPGRTLRIRWSIEDQPQNYSAVGGGVVYVYDGDPSYEIMPVSEAASPNFLGDSRYQWTEGLQFRKPWLMFVLILPKGYTLVEPLPKPVGTKIFQERLALYWTLKGDSDVGRTMVELNIKKYQGNPEVELMRINKKYLSRQSVPSPTNISIEDAASPKTNEEIPSWFPVAGVVFGAITMLFLMVLIVLSLFSREIPETSRFILVAFLALSIALSSTFLGGTAVARGGISLPFFKESPMAFAVTGGIAAFVIVLVLSYVLFLG